ncbi:MAG TPA: rRNA maturation RNase YbeY [Lachnospiraceae bacterium]|jgi:probable rRNA maturation factor|nr:probable rRNA maturation factor [Butyrivibrio sp. CAG:318]HJI31308.1 rRNA maturation RNase YbeY [Lachnospiraceae bacterium]
MTIEFEKEYDKDLGINYEEIADKVINAALDYEECPYEAEVSLTLVDNNRIHDINKEFRDIDRPTDVLSFPMVEYDDAGEFAFLEDEDDCFNPETGELMLGDIIISLDKVEEQAIAYGHSFTREYAFLIAHSMLHLMGYDHMTDDDASIMEAKQRAILDNLNITR